MSGLTGTVGNGLIIRGSVMNDRINKPAASARPVHGAEIRASGLRYEPAWQPAPKSTLQQRRGTARTLFAAPPVDLMTLVIADEIRRRQQAELQRDTLRDARYEMPLPRERRDGRYGESDDSRNGRRADSRSSGSDE
ncbi:hypothetical protein AAGS40_18845 [Paraburkholderia sp. PREW-6R]|uniref:hypothetical protein n=1 Tax=Paraburkholderia sp. PREW-6R TaxID=3141544 RepID=UPI0031F49D9C